MWGVLVGSAVAIGAMAAARRRPKTRVTKSAVRGGRSGVVWNVEYIDALGLMVVYGKQAKVAFERSPTGWKATKAAGPPAEVALIRGDFS